MIGSLKGKVILKKDKFILLDVSGVGYKIALASDSISKIKENDKEIFLFIHTHVKEDAIDLYGFINNDDLDFFQMLITVSGIGPKGALTILSIASTEILKRAIATGDINYLTKISGIGRKTAEKMVLELRDKFGKIEKNESLKDEIDALLALQSLGYSQNEARSALKEIPQDLDTNKKIKEALKILGGK